MKYGIYLLCELTLCYSIPLNPGFFGIRNPLSFQNGNQRFANPSQNSKISRPNRSSFAIGNASNSKKHSGMAIFFPTHNPTRNNNANLGNAEETPVSSGVTCNIENAEIFFQGKCQKFLDEEPCSAGHWLLANAQGIPYCAKNPCKSGEIFFRRKCVDALDTSMCKPFEILYIEFTGEVYCDCMPSHIFYPKEKRCLEKCKQGSCPSGMYIGLDCQENVNCISRPCDNNPIICKAQDQTVLTRNIFEVPALTSCPAGSKRDYLGKCQAVLRFEGPFSHRVPSHATRYSACAAGETKFPDGSCRSINRLLGR